MIFFLKNDPFWDDFLNIMSYPKKAKGWRKLILDNKVFRWNFVVKGENSLLKLQGSASSGQQAIVFLSHRRDSWLSTSKLDDLPNEPAIITSKFVSQAIEFAIHNGWKPEKAGSTINFEYNNVNFELIK